MKNNIDIKMKNIEGEVIIYTRPWFSAYYTLLTSVFKNKFACEVTYISDYSVTESYDLRRTALSYHKNGIEGGGEFNDDILNNYITDVIKRDRLLRTLSRKESELRIRSYFYAIQDYFARRKVACVISATVDQYVVDLIYLYCVLKGIPFIGYHISVLPGYTLFTARGETYQYRRVDNDEIDRVIGVISDRTFRPAYIPQPSKLKIVGLKRYGKNIGRYFYYKILSIFPVNKLNYHIEASLSESRKRLSFGILRALTWRCDNIPQDRYLYLPLQFHPECNSEYWDRSNSYEDYEEKIINFVRTNSPYWNIVVKEHPNMLGMRLASFYRALKESGCNIVHPSRDHRSLLKASYAVVTLNSSAGIEGLCEGKVIICLSNPYYRSDYHLVKSPTEIINSDEIDAIIRNLDSEHSLRDTVRRTIGSSAPVHLPDINFQTTKDSTGYGIESAKLFAEQIPALISVIKNKQASANEYYTIFKE